MDGRPVITRAASPPFHGQYFLHGAQEILSNWKLFSKMDALIQIFKLIAIFNTVNKTPQAPPSIGNHSFPPATQNSVAWQGGDDINDIT